jgi:Tse2 ADP-ribosyltransferase toxins
MNTTVLKDILLQQGMLDRYFEGQVPVHLWRALNNKKATSLFAMVEEPFVLSSGRPRPADIQIFEKNGHKWVSVADRPRGISTFDVPGVPEGKDWSYYRIPAGTVLPEGLAIVRDEYNTRFGATHYTIAPAYDMPLAMFKLLLNQLAASAIKEVA